MFRPKTSLKIPYERQGYIYFTSKNYKALPKEKRQRIDELCLKAGGEHHKALLEYVTTDATATQICLKHYIGEGTLHRMQRRYYMNFPKVL
ncbi:MAG: hypothetical protein IJ017_04525 [Oscillospiraceae bacterium]|nr:hypothetical protein [Oscillospiraceae bacterium]